MKIALQWGFAGFMALSAAVYFPSLSSLFMLLFAILCAPIAKIHAVFSRVGLSGRAKVLALAALFLLSSALAPPDTPAAEPAGAIPPAALTAPSAADAGEPPQTTISAVPVPAVRAPVTEPDEEIAAVEAAVPSEPELPSEPEPAPPADPEPAPAPGSPEPEPAPEPAPQSLPSEPTQAEYNYVGSSKSDKYHYPTCRHAKNIKPENLIGFADAAEGQAAGYTACGSCKPA